MSITKLKYVVFHKETGNTIKRFPCYTMELHTLISNVENDYKIESD